MSKIKVIIDFCNSSNKTLQNINTYLVYNTVCITKPTKIMKKNKRGNFEGFSAQKYHSLFEVLLPQIK